METSWLAQALMNALTNFTTLIYLAMGWVALVVWLTPADATSTTRMLISATGLLLVLWGMLIYRLRHGSIFPVIAGVGFLVALFALLINLG